MIPFYRDPSNILVPAEVTTLLQADFTFTTEMTPLPVYTDTRDPDMTTDTPPVYYNLAGVKVPADVYCILLADGTVVGPGNPLPTTGGGGGPVDAYDVSYTTPAYPAIENVGEALDQIFYVPTNITSFSGGGTYEIGTSISSVHLTWTINKDITSQSINHGIGSLDPSLRAYDTTDGPYTTNQSWTLTVSDGTTGDNASTSLTFLAKRYWGVWDDQHPDNSEILTLSQELASSRGKSITYNATGGKYPIYVYPTSFGALTGVTVGGLAFSDYTQEVISLTNAQGYTQNYYLTYFNGIQTGAAINVVWS